MEYVRKPDIIKIQLIILFLILSYLIFIPRTGIISMRRTIYSLIFLPG
jgi:hypothetical protein